ncbi:hypothetical protein CCHOA_09835 [Corynebacterium choanae]|uniref:Uncharacterized protein n=1 Tax=Corynebacterium choanae TaxID=1862358 RepID=A0A3G6JCF5_9CORY|nr:hypothetical protein CCHOA_09835 [Corynebacterium choanae]
MVLSSSMTIRTASSLDSRMEPFLPLDWGFVCRSRGLSFSLITECPKQVQVQFMVCSYLDPKSPMGENILDKRSQDPLLDSE